MISDYRNKVAVITGAANGLGRALAGELAVRRCHLALLDIDEAALEEAGRTLAAHGVRVTTHCVDVGSELALQRAAAEIEGVHGSVHLVINNAGASALASFANTPGPEFDRVIRTNFFGVVHGCRAFLPLLLKHAEGQVLNVSSCFAWLGYPGKTAYAASKGAVRSFSESLRMELAGSGVGVTLLYPGPLDSGIVRNGVCDSESRRKKEEQFLASRGLSLSRVAHRCLDKLLTNPGRIVVGRDYFLLDVLARFSPGLAERAVALAAARAGF